MTLSVAIVNWNVRDRLRGTLRSIYDHPPELGGRGGDFEAIVVDNASEDGSAEMVAEEFPQVALIANAENVGYARGNNQAIERSAGECVLLLNPDVILPPGGLERAVAFMRAHPDAGALGVRQVFPDGRVQPSVRGFPTPLSVFWELIGLSRLFSRSRFFGAYRMTWFGYDHAAEVDQPMGTFLLLSRRALDTVGLMDARFPIFFNEVDWCYRAKRAGFKIWFTPDVEIVHYGGASTRLVHAAMAWESRRGLLTYYRKHYSAVWFWPLYVVIAAASWLHARRTAEKRK